MIHIRAASVALAAAFALLLFGMTPVPAQELIPLGPLQPALAHHTVSTFNSEAQQKFDEGLTLVYAFNRDEAAKRFARAAQLDPSLVMAYWGIALANGPNLNYGMTAARLTAANEALAKAKALAPGASTEEQRYVAALAVRYPEKYAGRDAMSPGYLAYRDAMAKLHADFPDDLDAATLYAESVMDVEDWGWSASGQPTGSATLLAPLLESVLARNPDHVGANHYYVHVMDHTGVAQRALPSALKLSALPAEPAASHLVHMSGHNYLDNGLYAPLERDNKIAVDDDRRYAASIGKTPAQLDYFFHNLDFYLGGSLMLDDRAETERALSIAISTGAKGRNQGATAIQALAFARERRWNDVLALPPPPADASGFEGFTMHYARGVAFAAKHDARGAHVELTDLDKEVAEGSGFFAKNYGGGLSKLLGARIAHLEGDDGTAAAKLRDVIASVASLPPEVFAPWYYPTGEWLGEILFQSGDFAGAEAAFKADLKRTPHNARVLFGLMQTLSREGKTDEARALSLEIAQNWRGPLSDLRLDD
jgi:tetratricopeptide (TPR) repeat protein